ncbi:hypothetical protein EDM56_28095 [Brevibacillus fluminis]|uniref:DUF2185 domain-containing protein n=1 Tax=Brevibacillus fluminis TaxID=511487 RepID=A0A3M8CZF0_9BACL|nr:hypothetical protein [Brevibacillus fluminis]RNB80265.1 hypothetical protein EDM56_28095 [Brevibacillus fluminis]
MVNLNEAVFTTKGVVIDKNPILYVSHDEDDGAWQFHDGSDVDIEGSMLVSFGEILELDHSVSDIIDLPIGWIAEREGPDGVWRKSPIG